MYKFRAPQMDITENRPNGVFLAKKLRVSNDILYLLVKSQCVDIIYSNFKWNLTYN